MENVDSQDVKYAIKEDSQDSMDHNGEFQDGDAQSQDGSQDQLKEQQNNQGQKRQLDDQQNAQKKRFKTNKIDLRFLIQGKDAGAIIGKGGANIKKLRLEYKTIIQIPDCEGPERLLLIAGDAEAAIDTVAGIIPLVEDNRKQQQQNDTNKTTELRLLVHQSQAGCIIGKGGEKIKNLRQSFNLDVKMYSECAPLSTERVCQLQGKSEDIISALREILLAFENAPPRGVNRPYDPSNYNEYMSAEYGGFTSDRRAGPRADSNPRGNTKPPRTYDAGESVVNPIDAARSQISGNQNGLSFGGAFNFAGFGGLASLMGSQFQGQRTTNQVTIPNDLAGIIIGPRGSKIQQIRMQSGADVTIDRAIQGNNERVITISGTQEQIQNAQYLLQMTVKNSGLWKNNK